MIPNFLSLSLPFLPYCLSAHFSSLTLSLPVCLSIHLLIHPSHSCFHSSPLCLSVHCCMSVCLSTHLSGFNSLSLYAQRRVLQVSFRKVQNHFCCLWYHVKKPSLVLQNFLIKIFHFFKTS